MMKHVVLCLLCLISFSGFTQYLSGHIEYNYVPNTLGRTYIIKLILYTYENESVPDELELSMGDGVTVIVPKTSNLSTPNGYVRNIYEIEYTYSITGSYMISYYEESYDCETINYNQPDCGYYVSTNITISPTLDPHYTINYSDYLMKHVTPGDQLVLNVLAGINVNYDISYSVNPVLTYEFLEVDDPAYSIPFGMSIDSETGDITWNVPFNAQPGLYELIIHVKRPHFSSSNIKRIVFAVSNEVIEGFSFIDQAESEYYIEPNEHLSIMHTIEHASSENIWITSQSSLYYNNSNPPGRAVVTYNDAILKSISWTPSPSQVRVEPYIIYIVSYFEHQGYRYYDYHSVKLYVHDETVGVNQKNEEERLMLFPNPTTDKISLRFDKEVSVSGEITIYSLDGRMVDNTSYQQINELEMDVNHLSAGSYIMQVTSATGQLVTKKFIKK